MTADLPIHAVLPELLDALREQSSAVLVAPPGAGKTTAVAPALLNEPWCTGRILLLSPRRLAARAAAERMAQLAGEPVGRTIGYATRMDSKQSAATRVLVLTEGIFRNQIQADPELDGVSAVLFDEVHERSLDSDFGLALALDAQGGLRPDLRIVAMSATLDGARFAAMMDGAPVIESAGRSHPLELRHVGRKADARIEDEMAAVIRRALADEAGGLLAFLPGVAEIERTAERLAGLGADVDLHRLHGTLDPAAQRAAIAAAPAGKRKLVLATSIAETSLTLDGVRIVVDSGLARRPRYDRAAGMTRLVTERASQASATQRAGRAARQAPGVAYRLWEAAATAGMPPFDPPEILEADLSALLLDCALWGVSDPRQLKWIDPPPLPAIAEARHRLESLGALDGDGRPTPHGAAIARLPLPPRIAHMMVEAARLGWARLASEIAVLLSERGLGGTDADLQLRRRRWHQERGKRAEGARRLADRWARLVSSTSDTGDAADIGAVVALAFPDRLAKRRGADGADWISVGGRGFRLDPASPLAREEWLAVAEIQGAASGARILSAAPIDFAMVEQLFGDRIRVGAHVSFDPASGGVRTVSGKWLGAVQLAKGQDAKPDPAAVVDALVDGVRTHGLQLLPWSANAVALRKRAVFARRYALELADLSDEALLATIGEWLPVLVTGKRRLSDIDPGALSGVLDALLGWDGRKRVDVLAPTDFASPAGSHHAIDYEAEAGPTVTIRVQALFGLSEHPAIGGGAIPLVLSLTSPAGRPIQTTRDLPGFWSGSWISVAKEMRGRYPKHPWPDDPAAASATLRTKKADARAAGRS
ncbi:ATP-dependent helicase HrpB [Sphingomonas sp. C3-2]|uniref:ATP-dependent helicase HrpB n=1 Tax=Sphingomonas sp. C3-2 TaxID=3062169 RepID=UPI00294B217B|nr:ATP-dependent helicase HrpB [Sphingomonas sp. C3-2]WOK35410.1 ATP-dependent helicase HrpB [Sphingomonas sp. C3-2]